jgi:hypothetical protein
MASPQTSSRHQRGVSIKIAGTKLPRAHQVADIGRRDLIERRKSRAAAIAAPILPAERWRCREQRDGEQASQHSHATVSLTRPERIEMSASSS